MHKEEFHKAIRRADEIGQIELKNQILLAIAEALNNIADSIDV